MPEYYAPEEATVYGRKELRFKAIKVLHVPVKADFALDTDDTSPQLRIVGSSLYFYLSGTWYLVTTGSGGGGSKITTVNSTAALSALSGANWTHAILLQTSPTIDKTDNVNGMYTFNSTSGKFAASGGGWWRRDMSLMRTVNDVEWHTQSALHIHDINATGGSGAYSASRPPLFLALRNDGSEMVNSDWGAMICGSANGGAIVFKNDFSNAAARALKLGIKDNNGIFFDCLEVHYSGTGNTVILSVPFVPAAANTQSIGTNTLPFKSVAFRSLAADPTTADIGDGVFQVFKNTTSGTLKLWANDGGTMKSVALT